MLNTLQAVSMEQLFSIAGQAALIGWIILIFLPRRFDLLFAVPQYIIPFGLALLYAGLILPTIYTGEGGFGSLADVAALLSNEKALLAGWIHYLAFDLFIGAWIARQSDGLGIPRVIQAVLLAATFMFGPIGLALFIVMRIGYRRDPSLPGST
ncbi:MAG: ABA4-like family protein [Pseudomonadota bacterium]